MASQYPLQDKVIAVTGTSRGTGLALACYLLIRGTTVSICAISVENLAAALTGTDEDMPETWDRVLSTVVDISKLDTIRAWIEATVKKFGKLDGAANIAALEQLQTFPITELDPAYSNELIEVNVTGTFNCLKEEMRNMKNGGSIVSVGSITSTYASAGVAAYVACKHAVAAFEGAPRRIRVNTPCPPAEQFWLSADKVPCITKRLAEPWEIAASVAFLLGDESKFVTNAT